MGGDAKFQTFCDALRPLDEMRGGGRATKLFRRCFKKRQPAVKMRARNRQGLMFLHGLAAILAAHQGDGGPESAHALQMRVPVGNPFFKDRRQHVILPDAPVELEDKLTDEHLIDARSLPDFGDLFFSRLLHHIIRASLCRRGSGFTWRPAVINVSNMPFIGSARLPKGASGMTSSARLLRAYEGPALFSFGFRPFFLMGAAWALLAMALWIGALTGQITLPSHFAPADWHVHELLYGYLTAIVAGFLLTAVPNWTGRLPIAGWRLAALSFLWLSGRVALFFSDALGPWLAAALDLSFLAVLLFVLGREVLAGENWRNLKVLAMAGLLLVGNALFHAEAASGGAFGGYGTRLGVSAALLLIMLIGGRIVPSFTRNWLARRQEGQLPAQMGRFDILAIALGGAALLSWTAAPEAAASAALVLLAGALHIARLARWAGWRTGGEPLVAVLHLGYLFVPLGFLAMGISILRPDLLLPGDALHLWTTGAIGTMTLAVMTRATLGHTGHALHAGPATLAIYGAIALSAASRFALNAGATYETLLYLSAAGWLGAFGLFCAVYGPMLCRPRQS